MTRLGLAVLGLLFATNVGAQPVPQRVWNSYCSVGQFSGCVSVEAVFLPPVLMNPATDFYVTPITIRFENLEGRPGLPSSGGPNYGINRFSFSELIADFTTGPTIAEVNPTVYGNGVTVNGAYDYYLYPNDGRITVATDFGQSFVWGCTGPEPWEIRTGPPSTCDGGLEFNFDAAGQWSLTKDTHLSFGGAYADPQSGDRIVFSACENSGDCVSVPEPTSFLLLLSGALGLGVRLRRRGEPGGVA